MDREFANARRSSIYINIIVARVLIEPKALAEAS